MRMRTFKLRRDCATCGHDITLHSWHGMTSWPCKGHGPSTAPSDCACQDFIRPSKGQRRVKLGADGKVSRGCA